MAADPRDIPYVRLRASLVQPRDPLGRAHSLWLADDHMLWVCTSHFSQTAYRIDYRDIEAITVRPTALYAWTNVVSAVPCLVGAGLVGMAPTPWAILGICMLVPCLLILLTNLVLDRTCDCRLQTRAGVRTLHALCRYPQVRRALPILVPRIQAAQGPLPVLPVAAVSDLAPLQAPISGGTPVPPPRARHVLHAACFGMLAVQAVLLVLVVRFTSLPLLSAGVIGGMALVALCLVTVGLQHRRATATRVWLATWLATVGTVLGWAGAYACFWFGVFSRGLVTQGLSMENQLDRLLLRYARTLVRDGLPGALSTALLVIALAAALMALAGFAAFLTAPPAVAPPASGVVPPRLHREGP